MFRNITRRNNEILWKKGKNVKKNSNDSLKITVMVACLLAAGIICEIKKVLALTKLFTPYNLHPPPPNMTQFLVQPFGSHMKKKYFQISWRIIGI